MSVSLAKGERLSLRKASGDALRVIRLGLGWKAVARRGLFGRRQPRPVDLDASALLYAERTPSDVVFFQHLVSNDGSVRHTGDSLLGSGPSEDDESIVVDLAHVPPHITQIVFTVSSYTGQNFSEVESAHCRLVDEATGGDLARFELPGGGLHTGQIMAKVYREPEGGWALQAIGAPSRARTFQDLLPAIDAHL